MDSHFHGNDHSEIRLDFTGQAEKRVEMTVE